MVEKRCICWGAAIAKRIHLHLPSCSHGFESQTYHLLFYQFIIVSCGKDDNQHKRGREWTNFYKKMHLLLLLKHPYKQIRIVKIENIGEPIQLNLIERVTCKLNFFRYDKDGHVTWVTFNNMSRDSHMTIDLEQVRRGENGIGM